MPAPSFEEYDNPFIHFGAWMNASEKLDLKEPFAVTLSTVSSSGIPDARVVLMKTFSEMGFRFFTNKKSKKISDLNQNPNVHLLYYWDQLHRQVRINGTVAPLTDADSDIYWRNRSIKSQIASMLSQQSQPIQSSDALYQRVDEYIEENGLEPVKRPEFWGGYNIMPTRFEFWDGGEYRIHKRKVYEQEASGWRISYLAP